MKEDSDALPPNYRWNFAAYLTEIICFGAASTLISPSSVLPVFVRRLTTSAPVVGLVSTLWTAGWTLPQLPTARLIGHRPHKMPYLRISLISRLMPWLIAFALWAGLSRYPTAMLVVFLTCMGLFSAIDGFGAVAWFDILARAIPLRRRGRLFGTGQFIGGLAGIGAGAFVGVILDQLPFPDNYALLFATTALVFVPGALAMLLLREPEPESITRPVDRPRTADWFRPLVVDRTYRRLTICRILFGLLGLASSFYVGHAADVLRLPEHIVGRFVIAQSLAAVASSAALGWVGERWGPRYVIRIGVALSASGPSFALAAHLVRNDWLALAYPYVFVALGVMNSTFIIGFYSYILEIAPGAARTTYVGLSSAIVGVMALAPTAGGWLLEATSYTVLFSVTAFAAVASFAVSLGLKPAGAEPPARVSVQPNSPTLCANRTVAEDCQ